MGNADGHLESKIQLFTTPTQKDLDEFLPFTNHLCNVDKLHRNSFRVQHAHFEKEVIGQRVRNGS